MKSNELQFDGSCHVLYSRQREKEIEKIALHYPENQAEDIWRGVRSRYVGLLARCLGGRRNLQMASLAPNLW